MKWSWNFVNKLSIAEYENEETWASFLNVSMKVHADSIAGRQINQTWNN